MPTFFELPVTPTIALLAFIASFFGALVQGSVGYGAAIVAAPLLVLLDRAFVPGPMLAAGSVLALLMTRREWRAADYRGVSTAIAGRLLGIGPAILAVGVVPDAIFQMIFAGVLLSAVAVSVAGWKVTPTPGHLFAAGAVSGFTGTLASIGGPPMALIYQHSAGDRLRATMSVYFVIGGSLSVLSLWMFGEFGRQEMTLAALLLPGIFAGYLCSCFTAPLLDAGRKRPAVLAVASLAAVAVLIRAIRYTY